MHLLTKFNTNKPLLFFCGSFLTHEGLKNYKGETPAATIWIKGLLSGISDNGIAVKCFSPIWDSLFPKGKLFPGKQKYLDPIITQVLIRYLNLPFFRTFSVIYSLERNIIKAIKGGDKPIAILNYNTYPYYCRALKKISRKYPDIPWVNVVLDLDDPTKDNWARFLKDTIGSKASIFLSWWGFQNAPIRNKLHLDGGWHGELPIIQKNGNKILLYAGKFAKFGGIQDIIDAIEIFPLEDVIFEFYGKDYYQPLTDLAIRDKRVHIMGFVSDEQLNRACMNATAFLSPREIDFQGTRMIFPSKILFYLKFQKPILSAMLPGLSPEYKEVLIAPLNNTPNDWALTMEKIIRFSEDDLTLIAEKSRKLLEKKKWENQAASLLKFMDKIKKLQSK